MPNWTYNGVVYGKIKAVNGDLAVIAFYMYNGIGKDSSKCQKLANWVNYCKKQEYFGCVLCAI